MSPNFPLLEIVGRKTWKLPELPSFGKLPAHASFLPYPSPDSALTFSRESSPWYLSLNGTWEFKILQSPEQVSIEAVTKEPWSGIQVPGNWTMQDFGHPHYTNITMPFPNRPPDVPDENPTGMYKRRFNIPDSWSGRRIVLHIDGCEGALYVYVNGQPVGISKDARTPAEFDLTNLAKPGYQNEVLLIVVQWSDASFLEDQDHWWQAGLQRDIYLYSTGILYIKDVFAIGDLDEDYKNGILRLKIKIGSLVSDSQDCNLEVRLLDPQLNSLNSPPLVKDLSVRKDPLLAQLQPSDELELVQEVAAPQQWSAETPHLYTLIITLKSSAGIESTFCKFGFRKIEVRDRMLLVNGGRIMIMGVNYHDHDDTMGKAISLDSYRKDLHLMKQFTINAIRTSHYPKPADFYDLCDLLGFYVIDEANLEHHAYYQDLCHDPRYTNAYIERIAAMVERDKNHACVILWSLGNESGYGPNHDAAAGYARGIDPSRPLHYEGAPRSNWNGGGWHGGERVTDVVCPMYPAIEDIINWSKESKDKRPLIMCEYSHCMGNSNGNLMEYWEAFEKYPGLQGGFLWEWIDHGIRQIQSDGQPYWAYGGDFGDQPNDANFCIDGIVWPDRKPHPALFEYKYLAQPIGVQRAGIGGFKFQLSNKQVFSDLSLLKGRWELIRDGEVIQQGELPSLDIPAGEAKDYELPVSEINQVEGEYFVNFHFVQRESTPWAPAGHIVAWEQIAISKKRAKRKQITTVHSETAFPIVEDNSSEIVITGAGVKAIIDKHSGELAYFGRDKNLLLQGPRLNLWRAATDNDGLKLLTDRQEEDWKILHFWKSLGLPDLEQRLKSIRLVRKPHGAASVVITHQASGRGNWDDFVHIHKYLLLPSGKLMINHHVIIKAGIIDLPRIGISMVLNPPFERLEWYGRGPWENYPDRNSSAMIKHYVSTVHDQYVPYIVPQEHGHKTDVRWLELRDQDGDGLKVEGFPTFEYSASHFVTNDLYCARHTYDLAPRPQIYLNIDVGMRGLGSASCGPDTLDAYRMLKSKYQFKYSLEPIFI